MDGLFSKTTVRGKVKKTLYFTRDEFFSRGHTTRNELITVCTLKDVFCTLWMSERRVLYVMNVSKFKGVYILINI